MSEQTEHNLEVWKRNQTAGEYFGNVAPQERDQSNHIYTEAKRRYGFDETGKVVVEIGIGFGLHAVNFTTASLIVGIDDFVWSCLVMQHISYAQQQDYMEWFSHRLPIGGEMLVQFLVGEHGIVAENTEPHFYWTLTDLHQMLRQLPMTLNVLDVRKVESDATNVYHAWAYLRKEAEAA